MTDTPYKNTDEVKQALLVVNNRMDIIYNNSDAVRSYASDPSDATYNCNYTIISKYLDLKDEAKSLENLLEEFSNKTLDFS